MSLEDLQEAGVLLPEEKWGTRRLDSTLSATGLVTTGIVAVASAVGMFLGAGGPVTWISGALFLVDQAFFTWLALRAVEVENERAGGT